MASTTLSRFARRLTTVVASTSSTPATKPAPDAAAAAAAALRPHHAVVSVSGPDRTGIVNAVTSAVTEHGANMEDSRMALLGGDFAMIAYVRTPDSESSDNLAATLRSQLPSFTISVRETTAADSSNSTTHADSPWSLTLEGPDHPGIVSAVSQALAVNGSNIKEMSTETTTAPFAGYELFKLAGKVSVDEARLNELSSALDGIEDKFGSTISLIKESN